MFRNSAKTGVPLVALGGVMLGVGSLFCRSGAIIGLVLGLAVVGCSYWKSDTPAICSARAAPTAEAQFPEFFAIVREETADLVGGGEPRARALKKLDAYSRQVPMNVAPAQASRFIANRLAGRRVGFANLFLTHASTQQRVARLRGSNV